MIAPKYITTAPVPRSRRSASLTPREATQRRKSARLKRRYRACMRIGVISSAIVMLVVGYLYLITRATALDDRLITAQSLRASLQEQMLTLEDRRAALESRDRLFQIAGRSGLHEPSSFLIVDSPAPLSVSSDSRSFIETVTGWLHLI